MKTVLCVIALLLLVPSMATAQLGLQGTLLDEMAGNWVMRGTIGGDEITHDITAEWVLGNHYFRFHDLAREKNETGAPAYEAIVFIGWDEVTSSLACLWLDETGGGGLTNGIIGYAKADGDKLPFVFKTGDDSAINTTFIYDRDAGTWSWTIDIKRGGTISNFAEVTLTRE